MMLRLFLSLILAVSFFGTKNEKAIKKNRLIRQETLSTKITKTDYGITK